MTNPTHSTATPKISDRDPMTDFERRDVALLDQTRRVFGFFTKRLRG